VAVVCYIEILSAGGPDDKDYMPTAARRRILKNSTWREVRLHFPASQQTMSHSSVSFPGVSVGDAAGIESGYLAKTREANMR